MRIEATIEGLFVGRARDRWKGKPPSAILKQRADGTLALTETGFEGDEQADLTVHGGPEKAVHHYPADHYATWRAELGDQAAFAAGGFGENISTTGLTEKDVCIGDVFRLGRAVVQICQGRQPCWKLSAHTDEPRMAQLVQKTGRTGWYYRVIRTGLVAQGGHFELLERPQPDWSVRRVTLARFDPALDQQTAIAIASLPELSEGWRAAFLRKGNAGEENTDARLLGPDERSP